MNTEVAQVALVVGNGARPRAGTDIVFLLAAVVRIVGSAGGQILGLPIVDIHPVKGPRDRAIDGHVGVRLVDLELTQSEVRWDAYAATCKPSTSVAMTPIPNNHLVRLLTTHSPTHYL